MKTYLITYLNDSRELVDARYMSFSHGEHGEDVAYHFHGRTETGSEVPFLMVNPVRVAEVRELTGVLK